MMVARHHHKNLNVLRLIRTHVRKCPGENSQKIHKKPLDFCVEIWYNIYVPKRGTRKEELKMAYEVQVTAIVEYWCTLSDEDSEKVDKYISDCTAEDPLFPPTLEEAVAELYSRGEFDLYKVSTESDFYTKSIDYVEPVS